MYKKISHNIVEEHFDHPAVLPAGVMNNGKGSVPLKVGDPLPSYVMNEATMQFRMDSRTAWMKWAYSLINYAISLNGNLSGTDQVKARVHKSAVAISDILIPYYGPTAARAVATSLIAIDDVGMHYVEAVKAKRPKDELDKIAKTWDPYIADLAKLLNELNPNNWPVLTISDILSNIVLAWQDQLNSRAKGDILANEIAIETLSKLAITGVPPFGNSKGYISLADAFSRGIIAQFPELFAG